MKRARKLLSVLLGLIIVLAPAVPALAAEGDFTIENGVLTAYHGSGGDVVIPDGVTSIGIAAFNNCTGLTGVTIPDSVTSIGVAAFDCCTGLTGVTIPNSVTTIGGQAFFGCSGLTDVTIPDSVTTIEYGAFQHCSGLASVTIPDGVTAIGAFAFCGCSGLTDVTIPDSVTSIGYEAFFGCTGLSGVTIPDSVTSVGGAAFYGCTGLTSVTIGNGVTTIGDSAFSGCIGLTGVAIPDGVTSIGSTAFRDCTGLTSATIPGSVSNIGREAFYGCTSLTEICVSQENPFYTSVDGILFDRSKTKLICFPARKKVTQYTIPNRVTRIGYGAFYGCTDLAGVTIPNSVTHIEYAAFRGCTGLTGVTIPNSVTTIEGWAFAGCTGLTNVTFPSSVTTIGLAAFRDCTGLTGVTIPNSVTTIGSYAFRNCAGLADVYYGGTEAQWRAVDISDHFNEELEKAAIHFNSAGPVAHIAYASTQNVNVDGKSVEFQCYALKDANGNLTNYIKLRDLADILNGTKAQFQVDWDGSVTITTQTAYTPNGSEGNTPYSGDRAYQEAAAVTKVNGQAADLSAFVLRDDHGGGYTYYQLRDLGQALGFNVGWAAEKGIFVETGKPYDPSN